MGIPLALLRVNLEHLGVCPKCERNTTPCVWTHDENMSTEIQCLECVVEQKKEKKIVMLTQPVVTLIPFGIN